MAFILRGILKKFPSRDFSTLCIVSIVRKKRPGYADTDHPRTRQHHISCLHGRVCVMAGIQILIQVILYLVLTKNILFIMSTRHGCRLKKGGRIAEWDLDLVRIKSWKRTVWRIALKKENFLLQVYSLTGRNLISAPDHQFESNHKPEALWSNNTLPYELLLTPERTFGNILYRDWNFIL